MPQITKRRRRGEEMRGKEDEDGGKGRKQRSEDNRQDAISPTMWVPGIKLRSSGLAASLFTHRALSLALETVFTTDVLRINRKHPWPGISVNWEM